MFALRSVPSRDFNETLSFAIDDTIREFLGTDVLLAVHEELRTKYDVSREGQPYRMDTIYEILENKFGIVGAKTIGPLIAEKFYEKLGLTFHNQEGYALFDYVQAAKTKQTNHNHSQSIGSNVMDSIP